jgi:hypothetical protein
MKTFKRGSFMTKRTSSGFAAKHPSNTTVAESIVKAVSERLIDKAMTCQAAFGIVAESGAAPREVGKAIDLAEGRITKCQLGLFGYEAPNRKMIQAAAVVDSRIREAIESALTQGRLTCSAAWRIADQAGIARIKVADACEALKIKIKECQLGAF